ncbi:globin domain-containing protein [Tenacibaculum pacificus]|uniref:globin domain-containing protein n=1 Tax=Tenacibaculum pacificus TaxID=3018314 RepID=UPI0022F3A64D|nr:globin domain-containing protein [Tenacibaculum pacificus]WBX73172.1 globin domain-containing protein [Tenacibaculum pacificus]
MASKKTIEIVKSTAPVLEQHGEAITKVFYKLLFENHPELKDTFNVTNQKKEINKKH